MPDLTIEYYWLCETARHWETTINGHRVAWEYQPTGPCQYDWTCDCKGFQFRRKCKHVEQAKGMACRWHQYEDGGDVERIGKQTFCPKCHGPVTSERWAV